MIDVYLDSFLKLLIGLLSMVLVINISGKGNLAPTSAMDQVQNYVLGGIIGGVIYNPSISILQFVNIILIWVIVILFLKWLKTNNHLFKKILDGEPTIIINKGKLDVEACRKIGLTAQDVAFKLRSNNVYSIKKVKRAVIEQNGQIIIVLNGEENPKYPIIADGIIQMNVLEIIEKSEDWLLEKLKEVGCETVSEIFLAEYEKGEITVVKY